MATPSGEPAGPATTAPAIEAEVRASSITNEALPLTDFLQSSDNESFSDYSSDVSATTSVASSVFDYTYENGRRYHAYRRGQYLLPNDEKEQDRLDMTHHIFSLTLNGDLCNTKLEDPRQILDVGTGTGIWV